MIPVVMCGSQLFN